MMRQSDNIPLKDWEAIWNRAELLVIWTLVFLLLASTTLCIMSFLSNSDEAKVICEAKECPAGTEARLTSGSGCVCLIVPKPR